MAVHINAKKDDFAQTVIVPGDLWRAKFISETYLTDAKQICNVHNMLGYIGIYNGIPVCVMKHGMEDFVNYDLYI
jgi:purine-nucleoside phosphorylase|nr:hypothetical protein [Gilliamella apicola]